MITQHIADLLYIHECVIVPGFGGFIKAYSPAQIHPETHLFSPPTGSVAFNAGLSGNDGILVNHIAASGNTTYRQAFSEINRWVELGFETLKKGEKLVLEGIGELVMNASGKMEFVPSRELNFHPDSFGLPDFIAKPSPGAAVKVPDIQANIHKYKGSKIVRLIPETLKWAAVLAPFIAFALWGSLNGNIIENYVHNYTGMYSWVRSTPGKTVSVNTVSFPVNNNVTSSEIDLTTFGIPAADNDSFDPGMASYIELAKNNITIDSLQQSTPKATQESMNYYIVGGAFRDHDNALKLISILQEKGYPASVVDTTPGGLYVVSLKGYDTYYDAVNQLDEVKKAGFSSSWILKKQKG